MIADASTIIAAALFRCIATPRIESLRGNVTYAPQLDRLLRYESSLERAFDRTLNQLERLQRIRLGQPVPPTVNLNLSS
jgi:hypothetical protein